jgi:hypothetical protein
VVQAYHDMATFNAGVGGIDGSLFFELDRPEVCTFSSTEIDPITQGFTEHRIWAKQYSRPIQAPYFQVHPQFVDLSCVTAVYLPLLQSQILLLRVLSLL